MDGSAKFAFIGVHSRFLRKICTARVPLPGWQCRGHNAAEPQPNFNAEGAEGAEGLERVAEGDACDLVPLRSLSLPSACSALFFAAALQGMFADRVIAVGEAVAGEGRCDVFL